MNAYICVYALNKYHHILLTRDKIRIYSIIIIINNNNIILTTYMRIHTHIENERNTKENALFSLCAYAVAFFFYFLFIKIFCNKINFFVYVHIICTNATQKLVKNIIKKNNSSIHFTKLNN